MRQVVAGAHPLNSAEGLGQMLSIAAQHLTALDRRKGAAHVKHQQPGHIPLRNGVVGGLAQEADARAGRG